MSKSTDLVKNTLVIAAGRLSTQILVFLLLPLYTAFLTTSEYGQLDLILTYIALAAPLITVQMEMAAFRHLIDARDDDQKIRTVLSSSIALGLVGLAIGSIIFMAIGTMLDLTATFYIVGLFISTAASSFLLQVVRGLGKNGLFAIASLVIGVSLVLLSILLVWISGKGLVGVLVASMAANTIGGIFLCLTGGFAQHIRLSAVRKKELQTLLRYAWPLTLNHAGLWSINGISRTMIVLFLGFAATGIFAAAGKFPLIYTALYGIFAMAWTEAAALHIASKDKDVFFTQITDSTVRLFGSLAVSIIAAIGVFFPILVADDFHEARQVVPFLIVGAFLGSIVTHYGAIYLAEKKTKEVAKVTIQAVLLTSIITAIGIQYIGIYAAAIALVLTYMYLVIRRHYDIQKYVRIRYHTNTFPVLMILTIIVISLYCADSMPFSLSALAVAVAGGVYLNYRSFAVLLRAILGKTGKLVKR